MAAQFKPIALNFYLTPTHECPYLKDENSRTMFLSPEINYDTLIYSALIEKGFRRSGEHIYRPHCDNCQACISIRIPVETFKPNKQQKRCLKKASHFRVETQPAEYSEQQYNLFEKYISERHQDGDMYPASNKQFKEFLLCDWLECTFLSFYHIESQKLAATCVFDTVHNGLSAVYTYFEPAFAKYSLGRLSILKLIQLAEVKGLDYVYLGYWIKSCQKMAYKGEYRPIECFVNNQWIYLN